MILITGLGPGDFARIPGPVRDILLDPDRLVILRTRNHPASEQLAELREVVFCDDLYENSSGFEEVYASIADRVIRAASKADVVYAVPGSPLIGEFAVAKILASGAEFEILPAESFVDAVLAEVGYDPFERGLQILNGHELPDPLFIDKPTIIGHLDRPEILADVSATIARALPEEAEVRIFSGLGASDATEWVGHPESIPVSYAGFRASIWVDTEPGGLAGAIKVMARLRKECPWDREQTHASLAKNVVEEAFELIGAIHALEDAENGDVAPYGAVEEELGDVLLQVLFHANMAAESGAFGLNDLSEVLRQKLVRRHPHVFGDVEVRDATEVKQNWDRIKAEEKSDSRTSALDGIPAGMPALHRASKVQNRVAKADIQPYEPTEIAERVVKLVSEAHGDQRTLIGEALFAIIDLARRTGVDAELALLSAVGRFEADFRRVENGN